MKYGIKERTIGSPTTAPGGDKRRNEGLGTLAAGYVTHSANAVRRVHIKNNVPTLRIRPFLAQRALRASLGLGLLPVGLGFVEQTAVAEEDEGSQRVIGAEKIRVIEADKILSFQSSALSCAQKLGVGNAIVFATINATINDIGIQDSSA
ncbi:hypothetical protein K438DRAFT_1788209 [Mycena galopus ATCC 62051]|nr:hypothetical protein K438DRAFT_1788209 [Mycena galopus ATCC 62051]